MRTGKRPRDIMISASITSVTPHPRTKLGKEVVPKHSVFRPSYEEERQKETWDATMQPLALVQLRVSSTESYSLCSP